MTAKNDQNNICQNFLKNWCRFNQHVQQTRQEWILGLKELPDEVFGTFGKNLATWLAEIYQNGKYG